MVKHWLILVYSFMRVGMIMTINVGFHFRISSVLLLHHICKIEVVNNTLLRKKTNMTRWFHPYQGYFRKLFWVNFVKFTQYYHVSVNMESLGLVVVILFLFLATFYSISGWLEDDFMLFLHFKTLKHHFLKICFWFYTRLYFVHPYSMCPKSI